MGESEGAETNTQSHLGLAKEFLNRLPTNGVILHGTVARNGEDIKKKGLGQTVNARIDYFSFQPPQGTSLDNLSVKELRDIRHRFTKSLEDNIHWSTRYATLRGFYDESFSSLPENFVMDFLPAIVVVKRPDNILEVVRKNDPNRFDWETSGPIPAENILMVASLTKEEFNKLKATMSGSVPDLSEFDTNDKIANKVRALDKEARSKMARVLARKILDQLLTIQHQ